MKLYYSPGACSLAPHIVLREAAIPFSLEKVDTTKHTTSNGDDYYQLNAKGQVPLLELPQGERLSEGPIIAQFIADHAGRTDLAPTGGSLARYRVMEWQNYVTSELHKSYSPLFHAGLDTSAKDTLRQLLRKKYEWLNDGALSKNAYLTGDTFTVADAYLFVVTRWAPFVSMDLTDLTHVQAFMHLVANRQTVKAALAAEGLTE